MTRKSANRAENSAQLPRFQRRNRRNALRGRPNPSRTGVKAGIKTHRASWSDLTDELGRWQAAGRVASFWWRDDDAWAPSRALDRLIAISRAAPHGPIPLALAVIPARARMPLGERLQREAHIRLLQHGWCHANHAPDGERTMELGAHRPTRIVMEELEKGWDHLETVIGGWQFVPVLVPPWNRIDPKIVSKLFRAGFLGLSSSGPRPWPDRRRKGPNDRLTIVNVHIDIFQWRPRARFIGTGAALAQAVTHLAARRLGTVDPDEPTGLMTHHLQHDSGCWRFIERFLAVTAMHPAGYWLSAEDIFFHAWEPPMQSAEWPGRLVPE